MVALVLCGNCQPAGQPLPFGLVTDEPTHDCLIGHTTAGVLGGWQCPCPCPKLALCELGCGRQYHGGIECGYGPDTGEPYPAPDELREQIAAAVRAELDRWQGIWSMGSGAHVTDEDRINGMTAAVTELVLDRLGQLEFARGAWEKTAIRYGDERDALRAAVARLRVLADEADAKGQNAQAIPELKLVGNAYVGMAARIRRALNLPEPKELPYGTMLLTHDPLKEQGY